ncbi:hypothetical protein D3C77_152020 [compost metagenome]
MQPHHYLLALAVFWLFTLVSLPFLLATARRRAYSAGLETGLAKRQSIYEAEVQALEDELDGGAVEREAERRKYLTINAKLQATIAELEARGMFSNGLAVTHADHHLLRNSAETLALAFKTWSSMPGTEPWRGRATAQAHGLNSLATRIGAELRFLPATPLTDKKGEAA